MDDARDQPTWSAERERPEKLWQTLLRVLERTRLTVAPSFADITGGAWFALRRRDAPWKQALGDRRGRDGAGALA